MWGYLCLNKFKRKLKIQGFRFASLKWLLDTALDSTEIKHVHYHRKFNCAVLTVYVDNHRKGNQGPRTQYHFPKSCNYIFKETQK